MYAEKQGTFPTIWSKTQHNRSESSSEECPWPKRAQLSRDPLAVKWREEEMPRARIRQAIPKLHKELGRVFQFLTNQSTDTTWKITLIWEQSEFAWLLTTINVIFFVVVLWYRLQFREFHYYCDSSSVRVTMARSSVIAFLVYLLAGYPANAGKETWTHCEKDESQSLYNFTTKYLNGKAVSLEKYRGDVSLVLNVATYWGYTFQYLHLNALMKEFSTGKYKCGFSVLAFPCNQFMYQEPGTNSKEILNGLKCVRPGNGFQPHFPLFQKIQVNGKDEDQIYTFLKVINWLFLGLNVAHN